MMNGIQPYLSEATIEDPYYKLIIEKKYNRFWFAMEQNLGKKFGADCKDLTNKMLAYEVDERISLEEIKSHPWVKGQQACEREVKDFMQDLRKQINID